MKETEWERALRMRLPWIPEPDPCYEQRRVQANAQQYDQLERARAFQDRYEDDLIQRRQQYGDQYAIPARRDDVKRNARARMQQEKR